MPKMNAALRELFEDDAAEEAALQDEDSRVHADPAICVSDLEGALENFFSGIGYRNLDEIIAIIAGARCTWKTAPKAWA